MFARDHLYIEKFPSFSVFACAQSVSGQDLVDQVLPWEV